MNTTHVTESNESIPVHSEVTGFDLDEPAAGSNATIEIRSSAHNAPYGIGEIIASMRTTVTEWQVPRNHARRASIHPKSGYARVRLDSGEVYGLAPDGYLYDLTR